MSTQGIVRVTAGVPTGGQFAPTGHAEADAELGAGAFDCPSCGGPSDQDEGIPCDNCRENNCPCGQSLDDGEGYDGMCGDCADRDYANELHAIGEEPAEDQADEPAIEPERLSPNMGDGPIVTAPSGEYGFYAPIGGSEKDAGVAEHGPVVQIAQLVRDGTAWDATPARYYASGVSDLRPGTSLAIDMGAGWKLTPEDTAALATYAQGKLADANAQQPLIRALQDRTNVTV